MRIIIEEGATFIGHSEVTPAKTSGLGSRSNSSSIESAA
jgi:hypothetical protein